MARISNRLIQNGNRHTVETTLNYHAEEVEFPAPGTASSYLRSFDPKTVKVEDVRGYEAEYSLDTHGFEFHDHVSSERHFEDASRIEDLVYKEVIEMLKQKTGASRVIPFSHIVRRDTFEDLVERAVKAKDPSAPITGHGPARFVHVDQSYNGAVMALEGKLPDEAEDLRRRRWAIINVWRPVSTVTRDPLGVCDGSTVAEVDLVPVGAEIRENQPRPDALKEVNSKRFETWATLANPNHKWYFKSDMRPDEVLLIKCFDSRKDGTVRRAPHSAFVNPTTKDNSATRESIEIRTLVFWDEEQTG